MILRVSSNQPGFKTVAFKPGLNVVLADESERSTQRDSRNGLGKTTLLEIIHFCLGGSGKAIRVPQLAGWSFCTTLLIKGQQLTATREIDAPGKVFLSRNPEWLTIPAQIDGDRFQLTVSDWNRNLGSVMFQLPTEAPRKYAPSFRSLISYVVRSGRDAYSSPFEHFRKQLEWDKQVNNAYLLGLAWEDASEWQELKDKEKFYEGLAKGQKLGLLGQHFGSLGELQATRVRFEKTAAAEESYLRSFKVHPLYKEIEREANELTRDIRQLTDERYSTTQLLDYYRSNVATDENPGDDNVAELYEEAQVALPGLVKKRIEDVISFNATLIENRRRYLADEIIRLEAVIKQSDLRLAELSNARAERMTVLASHGALDEFVSLQHRHSDTLAKLQNVTSQIDTLRQIESGITESRIQRAELMQRARTDFDERRSIWQNEINIFNDNTEKLYNVPGNLVIDITNNGYTFKVEIERSGSVGISNMKIFCYDMMLAEVWSNRTASPGFWIHDSLLYDGVDSRQVAAALELAASKSEKLGFQYICTLNSDDVPYAEFTEDFDFKSFIRLTLTDESESSGLLGFRY